MKKNVLFVVDEKKMGGVSILLSDILNKINLKKYNIDILVLHNNGDCLDNLPKEIKIIYGTKFFNCVDYTFKEVIKSKSISKIFSKLRIVLLMKTKLIGKKIQKERKKMLSKKYDVEIAFKDGFCALITAYGDSIKKYHWLHTDYSMYDCTEKYHFLFCDIFPKFDKIIAISSSVLERFKNKYDVNNTDVIFNIIDKDKIINNAKKEVIEFDNNKLNFVSVGRIHNMKGYDRLVDVLNELNIEKKLDDVVVRIIGDGPDFDLVKRKVCEYNLNDKVLLMGSMKNPYSYLKYSDCFIMCSRYEPFGLVILESLILGVPVLSLDEASIHEIMNEKYGLIVDNSSKGLHDGILKIIKNPDLLKEYKKNLIDYHYPVEEIIMKIEKLLDA